MESSTALSNYSRGPHVIEEGNHDWNGQYFWDFLTKPDRMKPQATYQDTVVEVEETDDTHFVNNFQESKVAYEDTEVEDANTHFVSEMDYGNEFEDHRDTEPLDDTRVNLEPDYEMFKEAMESKKLRRIEELIESNPEALTLRLFPKCRTALHYAVQFMEVDIAKYLVGRMSPKHLEIQDSDGYTALALAAKYEHPRIEELLSLMVNTNTELVHIGSLHTIQIIVASEEGSLTATRFLCNYTDRSILVKEDGRVGVTLLLNCIYFKLFDLAHNIGETYPDILLTCDDESKLYPIHVFALALAGLPRHNNFEDNSLFGCFRPPLEETIFDDEVRDAGKFLGLVCREVGRYNGQQLKDGVYEAMILAAQNGTTDFITEMLAANKSLIWAKAEDRSMFLHAIEYRQEQVLSLIYKYRNYKDLLLKMDEEDGSNVLHLVAKSPPPLLDLDSSSFLHMQREVKWFKGVANLAKRQFRYDANKQGLVPFAVFIQEHKTLVTHGMESMKSLATAATVVGGLIVTIMFAALFTAPGGNHSTGYPVFADEALFKFFIVFDALSLFWSATSVLVFLGVLSARYSVKDFDFKLPQKMLIGYATLFFSITTMMLTFCTALAMMFHGRLLFVAPIILLSFVPIVFFSSSVCPLLRKIYISTYEPSIFDRNCSMVGTGQMSDPSDDIYLLDEEQDRNMMSYSYSVDKMV